MSQDAERQGTGQDFIVSELISELKAGSKRKDKILAGMLATIVLIVGGFLWYLNQYDFTSTTTTTTHSAEGVYAIVDSEGNVITSDLTPEQLQALIEKGLTIDGESNSDQNNNHDTSGLPVQ